jgi:hypothetical protein
MSAPSQTAGAREYLLRLRTLAFAAGAAGAAASLAGLFLDADQFFQSYLFAYVAWAGVPVGALGFLLLHLLTGGRWGFAIRRFLEAAAGSIPVMAILFIPVIFGMRRLYVWSRPDAVAGDLALAHKAAYLDPAFWIARTALYFVIWTVLAYASVRLLDRYDGDPASVRPRAFRVLGGLGLAFFGLAATFASVDWIMSLDPHWFSTMFGVLTGVGWILSAIALSIVLGERLLRFPPLSRVFGTDQFNDMGNFLLTFVMLWAYMSFSQFLIIWSGNIPEEIPWYVHRTGGGWQMAAVALLAFHFAVPFLVLLSRAAKRRPNLLAKVALGVFLMRFVDVFWVVKPNFRPEGFAVHWMDVALPVALGGIFLGVLFDRLAARPIAPRHDPRVDEEAEEASHG